MPAPPTFFGVALCSCFILSIYFSSRTSVEKMWNLDFHIPLSLSAVYIWCAISCETHMSDCFFWNFHWGIYKSWLIRVAGRCWSLVPAAQVYLSRGTCYRRKAHLQWGQTPFLIPLFWAFYTITRITSSIQKNVPTSCEDVALQWRGCSRLTPYLSAVCTPHPSWTEGLL